MKLVHLSDLHLGKRVNEFSMLEDQEYILKEILGIIDDEKPDAILIAGDVYDKSVPSAEAVELLDDFLVRLAKKNLQVFVISGNHDSPERLAFGNRLMEAEGIHLSPVYNGTVKPVTLRDEFGPVNFYMLPFIKPIHVRRFFKDVEIESYTDAVSEAVKGMNVDAAERNVLITHQFVTGAMRSDSEDLSVGGADNVDASVFDEFDYVALGHIHGPQNIDSERIRYCGTPLKYSFSEKDHEKSLTVVELGSKGSMTVRTVPLVPKRDMVEIKGRYEEVISSSFYAGTSWQNDYLRVILTDEEDVTDAMANLRLVYPFIMTLDYDNARTRYCGGVRGTADVDNRTPLELFADFYKDQNGVEMTEEQTRFVEKLIEKIEGGER